MSEYQGRKDMNDDDKKIARVITVRSSRYQDSTTSNSNVNELIGKDSVTSKPTQSNAEIIENLKLQICESNKKLHQERIMKSDIKEQLKNEILF